VWCTTASLFQRINALKKKKESWKKVLPNNDCVLRGRKVERVGGAHLADVTPTVLLDEKTANGLPEALKTRFGVVIPVGNLPSRFPGRPS
jgi:hypothetical protein